MIIQLFLIIQTIFHGCYGETPDSICSPDKPFEKSDNTCGDFNEICVKKGDSLCNNFQAACKQCPPTNYTVSALIYLKNQIDLCNREIATFRNQIELSNREITGFKNVINTSTVICTIIICFIQILVLVFILKYERIVKCFQICTRKDHSKYSLVNSRKRKYQNELESKIIECLGNLKIEFEKIIEGLGNIKNELQSKNYQSFENLDIKLEAKFQEIIDKIDRSQTPLEDMKIQFQFDGIDQEPIEMYVHNNHNIVQVKQQIYNKLPHAKHDDYKIMKLKYNGIILNDDNQYLLENIDKSNKIVNCFIDSSMNASDIIVVKLQGNMRLPDIIQINKNQSIDQLIGEIINSRDFTLFKEILNSEKQMKKTFLKLNSACLENELIDGDCIRIVQTVEGKLIITSMFDEKFCITAAYKNTNQVSSLIEFVENDYNWNPNNFVLFCNNQYLEEDKYICEYGICADSPVQICNIAKIEGIDKPERCEAAINWELYHATKRPTNTQILLKKYAEINLKNWKSQDWMMNELKTFLLTKNNPRFIQLFGVYFDDSLYVAMENMENGTLKNYLRKQKNFERKLICKWSEQILEGLEYLHDRKVVHRDLNPSNILVNINIDLKLSSFNLSKYEDICGPASFIDNDKLLSVLKVRYMAPELLSGGEYEFQCDIWSFGTVLVRIASGRKPLPRLSKEEVKLHIVQNGTVDYELSDKYKSNSKLKYLIDSCLRKNPNERCTIEKLKEMKNFISD